MVITIFIFFNILGLMERDMRVCGQMGLELERVPSPALEVIPKVGSMRTMLLSNDSKNKSKMLKVKFL